MERCRSSANAPGACAGGIHFKHTLAARAWGMRCRHAFHAITRTTRSTATKCRVKARFSVYVRECVFVCECV